MIADPEVRALEAQVALGVRIEAFLGTQIGTYLTKRLEADRANALEALADVDADDPKAVRAAQNRIRVIDTVQQYLADALIAAPAAIARLEQIESGE